MLGFLAAIAMASEPRWAPTIVLAVGLASAALAWVGGRVTDPWERPVPWARWLATALPAVAVLGLVCALGPDDHDFAVRVRYRAEALMGGSILAALGLAWSRTSPAREQRP